MNRTLTHSSSKVTIKSDGMSTISKMGMVIGLSYFKSALNSNPAEVNQKTFCEEVKKKV